MKYRNVYFIGIGGIGMSAIARFCKFKGCSVSGYDRTPSELTRRLEAEGIEVHYDDDCSRIPEDREDTLVVYTPAVPDEFGELAYAREKGYKVIKRSRMLGELTRGESCLAVAGTHGKTTTSTMIAHILTEGGNGCSAFLGGISKNYGTNMLVSDTPVVVAEADEFDRSFLQLHPSTAVITSMDADHLDIYGDLEHVQQAFREFASQVSETLILKYGLPIASGDVQAKIFTYHFDNPSADFHSANLRLGDDGHYTYDLVYPGGTLSDIRVGAIGWVNVENSIAAAAVCLCRGMDAQKVRHALSSFEGVRRRLDVHVNRPGLCYIDDYAHHPAELRSAISSVRQVFPGRKITGVFQPHLYTRTRDFASGFAEALSLLDRLILLDIYPAREEPIEGVSSELIFKDVSCPEKLLVHKSGLMDLLSREELDVLITLGAGDIDRFVPEITGMLEKR
ncbi:MAG TPA: UDP-N-acetylmuramate--L-alanine ligase [Candidatus Cryptobacteroides excrementigallinarum]|nr:UDP-N-acetylmuramate--L-alanine ligase [Candidatus Cryptobacteroides excrementigallinarum]